MSADRQLLRLLAMAIGLLFVTVSAQDIIYEDPGAEPAGTVLPEVDEPAEVVEEVIVPEVAATVGNPATTKAPTPAPTNPPTPAPTDPPAPPATDPPAPAEAEEPEAEKPEPQPEVDGPEAAEVVDAPSAEPLRCYVCAEGDSNCHDPFNMTCKCHQQMTCGQGEVCFKSVNKIYDAAERKEFVITSRGCRSTSADIGCKSSKTPAGSAKTCYCDTHECNGLSPLYQHWTMAAISTLLATIYAIASH